MKNCPCGSPKPYNECCEPLISGHRIASTAEELMRSRYSAYHQRQFDYILQTMTSPAADAFDFEDAKSSAAQIRWTRLEIIRTTESTVEFRAHYRCGQKHFILHETSQFTLENDHWYYTDGIQH